MKKINAAVKRIGLVLIIAILSLLVFAACSDSAQSTEKEIIKHKNFYCDYDGDEAHRFQLTMNRDYTYSLYIKDYARPNSVHMETVTGTWTPILTYEYKYCSTVGESGFFNSAKTSVLGIYLLDGYMVSGEEPARRTYFVYEKSTGKGGLHRTEKPVTEQYLEEHRLKSSGAAKYKGKVNLTVIEMTAE